jgi:hypothetical protein
VRIPISADSPWVDVVSVTLSSAQQAVTLTNPAIPVVIA